MFCQMNGAHSTLKLINSVTTVVVLTDFSSYPGLLVLATLLSCHPGLATNMASPFKYPTVLIDTYQAYSSGGLGIEIKK